MKKISIQVLTLLVLSVQNDRQTAGATDLKFGLLGEAIDGQGPPVQLFNRASPKVYKQNNLGGSVANQDADLQFGDDVYTYQDDYNDDIYNYDIDHIDEDDDIDYKYSDSPNRDKFDSKTGQKLPDSKNKPDEGSTTNGNSQGTASGPKKIEKDETKQNFEVKPVNPEEMKYQSLDFFEKWMYTLAKEENRMEACIIGSVLMLVGIISLFVGALSLQVTFGIMCSMIITILFTFILCFLTNQPWHSEMGWCLTAVSLLSSAPIVQYLIRYTDKLAVPLAAGLSLAAIAQIVLNLAKMTDTPPYFIKTASEASCFLLAFLVALKLKDHHLSVTMAVTSVFGSYACTMAGMLLANEMPVNGLKFGRNGKISLSRPQFIKLYAPCIASFLILTLIGFMYQREQNKDKERLAVHQQQFTKLINSRPKITKMQIERTKAKMAGAAKSAASAKSGRSPKSNQSANGSTVGGTTRFDDPQSRTIHQSADQSAEMMSNNTGSVTALNDEEKLFIHKQIQNGVFQ